jgi:hypothetical protein
MKGWLASRHFAHGSARAGVRGRLCPQPEHLVKLRPGQRPVGGCHGAQYLRVQLDLIERDTVVKTEVDVVFQRHTSVTDGYLNWA